MQVGQQAFSVRVPAKISVRQKLVGVQPRIEVRATAPVAAMLRTSKGTTTAPAPHAPLPVPGVPQRLTLALPPASIDGDSMILTIVPLH
ncbi:MAG: hypothetical protein Fues2KO_10430 [Fuerstiella sp.]